MKRIYEWLMIIFAIAAVSTIWYQTPYNSYVIWTVWSIFFLDFLFQLAKSKNKIQFLKSNPFLLIAIIPIDAIFQFARFARIIHLFRLKTITKYFTKPFVRKLKKKSMVGIAIPIGLILISSIALFLFEPSVTSIDGALKYGFLSIIMFGHVDIEPFSLFGQGIIISITLFGVLLHGIILGFLFDYLEKKLPIRTTHKKKHTNQ